jgi:DNA-binding transcriptional regulator YdaS (Cro superfamily)
MDLRTYLNGLPPLRQHDFASRCGTSLGYLRKALSTGQFLGADICVAIERESERAVTRQELRPDDWQRFWPELGQGVHKSDAGVDTRH